MNEKVIAIGSDHAAFGLKKELKIYLEKNKFNVVDFGCHTKAAVDYANYAHEVSNYVLEHKCRGLLLCGSGIGMSITANRHHGVRAALCHSAEYAELARKHNDSNVLVLGARFLSEDEAIKILDTWLHTKFEGGRHQKRLELIERKF